MNETQSERSPWCAVTVFGFRSPADGPVRPPVVKGDVKRKFDSLPADGPQTMGLFFFVPCRRGSFVGSKLTAVAEIAKGATWVPNLDRL